MDRREVLKRLMTAPALPLALNASVEAKPALEPSLPSDVEAIDVTFFGGTENLYEYLPAHRKLMGVKGLS